MPVFECNPSCACDSSCPNRVVQNGSKVELEVRKTVHKGWGVFTKQDLIEGGPSQPHPAITRTATPPNQPDPQEHSSWST